MQGVASSALQPQRRQWPRLDRAPPCWLGCLRSPTSHGWLSRLARLPLPTLNPLPGHNPDTSHHCYLTSPASVTFPVLRSRSLLRGVRYKEYEKSFKRVYISCLRVTFLTSRTKSCPLDPCCSNPVGRVCTWSYFRLTLSWLVLVLVHLDSTEI